MVENMF